MEWVPLPLCHHSTIVPTFIVTSAGSKKLSPIAMCASPSFGVGVRVGNLKGVLVNNNVMLGRARAVDCSSAGEKPGLAQPWIMVTMPRLAIASHLKFLFDINLIDGYTPSHSQERQIKKSWGIEAQV